MKIPNILKHHFEPDSEYQADKSISKETGKINIVPTFENLLITYCRLYSRMNERGKKLIEMELSKYGKALDQIKQ